MSNKNNMGNKSNKTEKSCSKHYPPEIQEDDMYLEFIKSLKYDTNKIELNLKKCTKK